MAKQTKYCCFLVAGLALAEPLCAQQWFPLANAGTDAAGVTVEIDLQSVRARSPVGEGVIRVTFDVLQPHPAGFGFRSFVGTAQFDCQRRTVQLASAAYFAQPSGEGVRVGSDSSGRESGMPPGLLERVPATVRQALLRASCAAAPTN
ncbi:MAG: hypothetical protein HYX47_18210 [Burkholderiales bacterium]|nr:hypothetical protein [Burkholderiales bacterium]